MRSSLTRRRRMGAAAIAVLAAGSFALAACGDDDDTACDDSTETTAGAADNVEFCENIAAVDAAFAGAGPMRGRIRPSSVLARRGRGERTRGHLGRRDHRRHRFQGGAVGPRGRGPE